MNNVIAKIIISDKDNKTEIKNVTVQILKNNDVVQEWSGLAGNRDEEKDNDTGRI